MVFLYRLNLKLPFYYGLDCKGRGPGPRKGSSIRDFKHEGSPSNSVGFRDCLLVARGVNDQVNLSILNHIHYMGSALPDLIHSLNGYYML